ncbi:nicotinamide-nucleotide amidase [Dysgonomonas sp. PH5-45]|uniref:CinA family nicotinamide mononucleotide deamidase-related protein n=1 Tax=unclassified Dysgonomonas TaxID=2630389 RepID=UPI0024745928|nr:MULTISPECIES: CinA family nicotinamide mononucleotide deamidase-related protein [unclassified Dysgonomonas]MDH6354432.1 nicotinamide-nucleotide amidase [Dysgonomonas sp. PH5-45]MDH6387331.1 nicotinamide-nucleotide amidase [Dysgonomonas sp. PH5-37]
MKTAIITIGDEILIGQIVDTNSAWISEKMTQAGFEIEGKISIGDDAEQIKDTITRTFKSVDVILMTGGLGPTKDDITKKTLCEYYGTSLVFSDDVLRNIEGIVIGGQVNELTRNQAYIPKDCTVIQNRVGTAPITWFERDGKVLVSMPGVPYEMKYNMEHEIIPRLMDRYDMEAYLKKIFIVGGYTESALAMHIADFESSLPSDFGLAYLPTPGMMKLRLFVKGEHRKEELERRSDLLRGLLGDAILGEEDIPIEKILGLRLIEKGLTVSTAESCTGGNIARLITSVAGSSKYFRGSIVAYANDVKVDLLGVSSANLERDGAVSEAVVIEMAQGACQKLNTDCSIATSGIAGPDGGTAEKPVGTIWIATSYKGQTIARLYNMGKYREANIMRSSNLGMIQLLGMMD